MLKIRTPVKDIWILNNSMYYIMIKIDSTHCVGYIIIPYLINVTCNNSLQCIFNFFPITCFLITSFLSISC